MSIVSLKDWRDYPPGLEKYQLYLASREWAVLKEAVRKRSEGKCERCRDAPAGSVHHQTYVRVYHERLEDLIHVCNPCHEFLSAKHDIDPMLLAPGQQERRGTKPMSVGCSSFTSTKWERLVYLLEVHAQICRIVIKKHSWTSRLYHWFDFYAGPGIYSVDDHPNLAGHCGSPILAIKTIERFLPCRPFLFDPFQAARLQANLESVGIRDVAVGQMKCEQAVDSLFDENFLARSCGDRGKPYGLAFFDPNGPPNWDAIRRFASLRLFGKIDLLININASNYKWCVSSRLHPEATVASEQLRSLGKKWIYLWKPHPGDRHQFTLAYCTNGPIDEFEALGFRKTDNPRGKAIQRRLDHTRSELKSFGPQPGYLPLPGIGED